MLARFGPRLTLALAMVVAGSLALAASGAYRDSGEANSALRQAESALAETRARAARLERDANAATVDADRTRREGAAVAARIQQAESEIGLAHARIAMLDRARDALRLQLARQQVPLVRLTAALELMARRPLVFSLMRTESLRQTVYLRAVLETVVPELRRRTASLRAEITQGRDLEARARALTTGLEVSEQALALRRSVLVAIESRQRLAERLASGNAARENDHALSLAEDARDLGSLVARLHDDDRLAVQLAALPGPVLRPDRPDKAGLGAAVDEGPTGATAPVSRFTWIAPVAGRVVTGFGEASAAGSADGITLAPAGGAEVVAPAAGRVAFAGPYRGYGRIVIIEHDGGWSSLVTNLARLDVSVGETLVQGSPLGAAGTGNPTVMAELRKDGRPVNPLGL